MKKFILLLAALFTLALSTTAFAASTDNGAALNKEEAAATQLVNALLQNGSLSSVDGLFHPEFKKNINDTNFKALQKDITEKLGTMPTLKPAPNFWRASRYSFSVSSCFLMSWESAASNTI